MKKLHPAGEIDPLLVLMHVKSKVISVCMLQDVSLLNSYAKFWLFHLRCIPGAVCAVPDSGWHPPGVPGDVPGPVCLSWAHYHMETVTYIQRYVDKLPNMYTS